MKIGQELTVASIWSVTGEQCQVTLLEIDPKGPYLFIQYGNGYTEWLPITSFTGCDKEKGGFVQTIRVPPRMFRY
jgi:hypothetical protein